MTRSRGSMRRTWPSVVTTWLQDGTYILPLDRPYLGFWWHDCDRPFLSFFSQSAIRAARCMCENEVSPSDILSSSGSFLPSFLDFDQIPCWDRLELFPRLVHCGSGMFIAWSIGTNFVYQVVVRHRSKSFVCNVVFMIFTLRRFHSLS